MVLSNRIRPLFLFGLALAFPLLALLPQGAAAATAEAPNPGEVNLPLKDYLALVDKAEALEKERARQVVLRDLLELGEFRRAVLGGGRGACRGRRDRNDRRETFAAHVRRRGHSCLGTARLD